MAQTNRYLFPELPAFEMDYPVDLYKTFVVHVSLLNAFHFRVFMDQEEKRSGVINTLKGPVDAESSPTALPFEEAYSLLRESESLMARKQITLNIETDFVLGAIDIVTFPVFYSLIHNVELSQENGGLLLWKINSNILNYYYPLLHKTDGVLSVLHFNEEPIDDAPTHNVVLFGTRSSGEIRELALTLLGSQLTYIPVSKRSPKMDDRYVPSERRPDDGEPFDLYNLSAQLKAA
jgi:hypothetical protein